jgi:hypothetical protein
MSAATKREGLAKLAARGATQRVPPLRPRRATPAEEALAKVANSIRWSLRILLENLAGEEGKATTTATQLRIFDQFLAARSKVVILRNIVDDVDHRAEFRGLLVDCDRVYRALDLALDRLIVRVRGN